MMDRYDETAGRRAASGSRSDRLSGNDAAFVTGSISFAFSYRRLPKRPPARVARRRGSASRTRSSNDVSQSWNESDRRDSMA